MKKQQKTPERYFWADLIRSFAIILVIFGHMTTPAFPQEPNSLEWWTATFYGSFARIGVPLFVILSGALILPKPQPYKLFFTKRFNRLLIPWILWALLFTIWYAMTRDDITTLYQFIKLYYQTFLGQFWFLPMLFGLYFLTPIIWRFLKSATHNDIWYAVGIWFALVSLTPFIRHMGSPNLPLSTAYVVIHSGYYLLGYIIVRIWKNKIPLTLLFLGFLISIICNALGQGLVALSGRPINFFAQNSSPFIVIATVALFLFLYFLCQTREKSISPKIRAGVTLISSVSFGVFLAHGLVMELFEATQIGKTVSRLPIPYFVAIPLRTVVIFSLSGIVILLLRRIPGLKVLAPK